MKNNPPTGLGGHVKDLRKDRGWSQADLAARSGLSQGYISKIEEGRLRSPSADRLGAIASAFNMSIEQLLLYSGIIVDNPEIVTKSVEARLISLIRELPPPWQFTMVDLLGYVVEGYRTVNHAPRRRGKHNPGPKTSNGTTYSFLGVVPVVTPLDPFEAD